VNPADLLQPLPFTLLTSLAAVVLLLPLVAGLVLLLFRGKAHGLLIACQFAALLISSYLLLQLWPGADVPNSHHTRWNWFSLGTSFSFTVGIWLTLPAAILLVVVNAVALLVQIFSIEYMREDGGYNRYFAFLGFFVFAMLGLVLADNLLVLFCFWEAVGLASYLLIGFWYSRPQAAAAAKKAFLTNRIGDVGFLLALLILYAQFRTLDLTALLALMPASYVQSGDWQAVWSGAAGALPAVLLTVAGLGLLLGAIGKSAQFPLQIWLPDAMEGPTPVSALLHAATMVAAGVYLLSRVFPLLTPEVLDVTALIGATTAFMGAFAAFAQHDIKKVLAFSTISQLGFMVMGMGTGGYDGALFHLLTHAFFKAGLFLSAGAIIYALHDAAHRTHTHFDAQDMRNMGGLRLKLPFTFSIYLLCMLALSGLPFLSGFLSKDAILTGSLGWASIARERWGILVWLVPLAGFTTALLTPLYMGRQLFLVFFGENRLPVPQAFGAIRDVPILMRIPLLVLAVFSIGIWFSVEVFDFNQAWPMRLFQVPQVAVPGSLKEFVAANRLYEIREAAIRYHTFTGVTSAVLVLLGLLLSYFVFYLFNSRGNFYTQKFVYRYGLARLSYSNWHLDAIYRRTFIAFCVLLMRFANWLDRRVLDRAIDLIGIIGVIFAHIVYWFDRTFVDGTVHVSVWIAGQAGHISRSRGGRVQQYLLIMLATMLVIMFWMFF
jgi:NADH-quinone oxidoreductase subunit L